MDAAQPPFFPHSVHGPSLRWDDAFDGLVERMINSNDQKTKFLAFDGIVGAASYVQLHGVASATDIIPVHCRKGKASVKAAVRDVFLPRLYIYTLYIFFSYKFVRLKLY